MRNRTVLIVRLGNQVISENRFRKFGIVMKICGIEKNHTEFIREIYIIGEESEKLRKHKRDFSDDFPMRGRRKRFLGNFAIKYSKGFFGLDVGKFRF